MERKEVVQIWPFKSAVSSCGRHDILDVISRVICHAARRVTRATSARRGTLSSESYTIVPIQVLIIYVSSSQEEISGKQTSRVLVKELDIHWDDTEKPPSN